MMPNPTDMLQALYRDSPTAVIVTDTQRALVSMNPAAERLFGHAEAELAGLNAQILYADPRDYERLGRTYFNPGSSSDSHAYSARYRTRLGRVFDGETVASPIIPATGIRTGFVCIVRDVTAELALQARLEASDLQLRVALSSANEGTFSLNLKSGLGSTRGFINEFLGIRSADATISLARWTGALHEEDQAGFQRSIELLAKRPTEMLDTVYRARRADGAWRWLKTRGRVSEFGSDGEPLRISGIVADVTERRELEIRLAEREQQLENAIGAGSCGIWELDPVEEAISVIGPIRDMLGVPPTLEKLGFDIWVAAIHPEDFERVASVSRLMVTGESDTVDVEYRVLDVRTGKWVWLHSRGQLIKSSGGRRLLGGVLIDISAQKQLKQKLADSERLMREAQESVRDGAWSVDLETDTIRASGLLSVLVGTGTANEAIPVEAWLRARPVEDYEFGLQRFEELKRSRQAGDGPSEVNVFDFRVLGRDGEVMWVRTRGRVIEWDANGKPLRAVGTHSDVTEEKRLQAELDDRDLQFREALAATHEGAWRINLKTRISDVTAVISEMIGLPPRDARIARDELVSRIHKDDRPIAEAAFAKLDSGEADTVDYTVRFHSQKAGWIHIHSRGRISARDPQGKPLVATGFLSDVTERLETAKRLQERELQLAEAIQSTSLGIFSIDTAREELWMRGNVVAELFDDHTEIRISSQAWLDRVHPDDLKLVSSTTAAMFDGSQPIAEITYRMKSREGHWTWYKVTGRVVEVDEAGRVHNVSGVIWNVDQAERLSDTMLEERRRVEAIYRATPALMHTIDSEGRIVSVSDYWLTYLGYERDEVIGHKSTEFLADESAERAVKHVLPQLFETGFNKDIPYRFVRKDGKVLDMLLSSFLERDETGAPLRSFAVVTDVTPLCTAYAQLERSNAELDRFATVASHDLQEPLRKVAAFAGLIRRRYADKLDDEGERSLDYLVDAAQRMQRLIDDLLTYSRLSSQKLKPESVDLAKLLDEVIDQLDASISESGARLDIAELPTVNADPLLMRQIFQNLVSNAVKYRGDEAPQIEIRAEPGEDAWLFSVQDNGIGIDAKFFEKIFAPFQRLHSREAYSGTGIGLAIVRQAVERHDGRIWVESTEGQGSVFRFSIPNWTVAGSAESPKSA